MTKHINEVLDTGRPDNKLFQYVLHQEERIDKEVADF